MKKLLGTTLLALAGIFTAFAQTKTTVQGTVTASGNHQVIAGAIIQLGNRQTLSNDKGQFDLGRISTGTYTLTVNSLGYLPWQQELTVTNKTVNLTIELSDKALLLQPLEIRSVRASQMAPFAKTNITKEEITKNNLGQDIPFLLNQTPSVVINSDAGNGVGYTGIKIRGTDATRVNVTLNGIPYNDAESMGTYYVDLPDFSSSVNSIQIQRGVGTSSNGAGAFGATMNLSTNEFHEKAYAELNNSTGSFNTWKNTLRAGTGLIDGHFTVDARLSRITSDGYIDRASSNLKSFYLSGAYYSKQSSLRLNIFSGKEKTYQAWYGVPFDSLTTHRTYNPAGTEKPGTPYDNQTDNYTQTHYQLFFNHTINELWSFNTAAFLTRGYGYYEEYKADQAFANYGLPNIGSGSTAITQTDLVRQRWLDNYFYGQILSAQYKKGSDELTIGGGWTYYDGKHYGTLAWLKQGSVPAGYHYYDYPAHKSDINAYVKWQHALSANWSSFADLQYRHVNHTMTGFEGNASLNINRSFDFVNPKLGFTYHKNSTQVFFSYALGQKEPNRDDFQASLQSQPKSETLHDIEIGIEEKKHGWQWGANLYYMYDYNQLVLTGQINDVGAYTRKNVPHSYRLGLELQASGAVTNWLHLGGNLTLSRNKVGSFIEYIDNYDNGRQNAVLRKNTDLSFSPAITGAFTIAIIPAKNLEFNLLSKYVSKMYMDNSQDEQRKLNSYFTEDFRVSYTIKNKLFKEWRILGQLNNIFNKKYEPNGYTYSYIFGGKQYTENGYYPMAGTNWMLGINISL
jgi:iron complex outermembrane receptor protein